MGSKPSKQRSGYTGGTYRLSGSTQVNFQAQNQIGSEKDKLKAKSGFVFLKLKLKRKKEKRAVEPRTTSIHTQVHARYAPSHPDSKFSAVCRFFRRSVSELSPNKFVRRTIMVLNPLMVPLKLPTQARSQMLKE